MRSRSQPISILEMVAASRSLRQSVFCFAVFCRSRLLVCLPPFSAHRHNSRDRECSVSVVFSTIGSTSTLVNEWNFFRLRRMFSTAECLKRILGFPHCIGENSRALPRWVPRPRPRLRFAGVYPRAASVS